MVNDDLGFSVLGKTASIMAYNGLLSLILCQTVKILETSAQYIK